MWSTLSQYTGVVWRLLQLFHKGHPLFFTKPLIDWSETVFGEPELKEFLYPPFLIKILSNGFYTFESLILTRVSLTSSQLYWKPLLKWLFSFLTVLRNSLTDSDLQDLKMTVFCSYTMGTYRSNILCLEILCLVNHGSCFGLCNIYESQSTHVPTCLPVYDVGIGLSETPTVIQMSWVVRDSLRRRTPEIPTLFGPPS